MMEGIMGSSSSLCLKLVSCKMGFLCFRNIDHHFMFRSSSSSSSSSPLRNTRKNNKDFDFKLSISVSSTHSRGFRPVSLSSSHTQADVKSQELLVEESLNGYTIEAEVDEDLETKEKAETKTVRVRFQLQKRCSFGQNFLIVGDDPIFGLWDPTNAIPLTWSEGHVWTVDLDIPIRKCIKFKFIKQDINGKFTWQPGPDRILECWESEKIITVCEDWENPDSRTIIEASPTLDQVEESVATTEMQTVAAKKEMPVEPSKGTTGTSKVKKAKKTSKKATKTEEPKGYAIKMKEMLVSNEGVPVLVPGLSQLPTTDSEQEPAANEGSKDEPESAMNGTAMIATGVDMAMDLKLPELESKQHENQDSCDPNEHRETQYVAEERDHETTQPMESLPIQSDNNFMQKLLGIFGFR